MSTGYSEEAVDGEDGQDEEQGGQGRHHASSACLQVWQGCITLLFASWAI